MKLARKNADRPTTRVGAALAATAGVGAAIATAGKQKQRAAVSVVIAVGGSCGILAHRLEPVGAHSMVGTKLHIAD